MDTRRLGRWATTAGTVAVLAGAQALVQLVGAAPASAAVPGYQIVSVTGAFDSSTQKSVTANCPSGKRLIGTGASLSNVIGQVSISNVLVSDNAVTAYAIDDQDGFSGSWAVNASAICASVPAGYERKTASSANDSSTSKLLPANCSAGKKALGQGWAFGANGQAHLNYAGIGDTGVTQIVNEDDDGTTLNWSTSTTVICATA